MIEDPSLPARLADTDTLRVKLVSGELVCRPFESGNYISADSVGATVSIVAAIGSKEVAGATLRVQVAAGANGARIQFPFFGRKLGLRLRRTIGSGAQTPAAFDVRVDGVVTGVSTDITKPTLYSQALEDGLTNVLIADDLAEGEHLAEITVVAPSSGTDTIYFHGYLVERRAGYQAPLPTDVVLASGNTPTAQTAIYDCLASAVGVNGVGRRISKVRWQNNSGGAITDLIVIYNSITYAQPASIAAKEGFELTFNPPVVMNSAWTHASAAGGGANLPYFVFGSY